MLQRTSIAAGCLWVLLFIWPWIVSQSVLLAAPPAQEQDFNIDHQKPAPTYPLEVSSLAALVGHDLRDSDNQMRGKLAEVFHEPGLRELGQEDFRPWYIWRTEAERRNARYLVLFGHDIVAIPSAPAYTVRFYDSNGRKISESDFTTGWRLGLASAAVRSEPILGGAVIDVRTAPYPLGGGISREIYGIIGDRLVLVRMEDSTGKAVANEYGAPNQTVGTETPNRTADEWQTALSSANNLTVLEALMWLGGRHRTDPSPPRDDVLVEDSASTRLLQDVWRRVPVKQRVSELAHSKNEWIREAAVVAATERR